MNRIGSSLKSMAETREKIQRIVIGQMDLELRGI